MKSRAKKRSDAHQTAPPASRWIHWLLPLALIVATFIVYIPAMKAGFIWDDEDHISHNLTLRSIDGLRRIWFEVGAIPQYYPLVHSTFWVEYHLWKLNPAGYHIINIALHALGAVMLYRLLLRLGLGMAVAWFAAAVFALHPVHVESVAWVTERKNVLSAVFYFGAMLAYLRFDPLESADSRPPNAHARPWRFYALAFALFLCALMSKTVTCSLPAAILLLIWWKRGRITARDLAPTIPMFMVGLAAGLLTAWLEKYHVGAQGDDWDLSMADRFVLAGRVAWFYVYTLLWPVNLAFIYPRWAIDASQWWQWLFSISAAAVVVALFVLRNRIGRGPLVAVLFFGGTLVPALGFFDVYPFRFSFVADHFQHLASLGVTVLIVAVIAAIAQRAGRTGSTISAGAGALILCVMGWLTWRQCLIYDNLEALWRDTLTKNRNSYMPHFNLARLLYEDGRPDEALREFTRSLECKPGYAPAECSIGQTLVKLGRSDEAMPHYERALELDPDYQHAHNSIGALLAAQGRLDEAIERYKRALALTPSFVSARNNLGTALAQKGDLAGAIEQFELALIHDPDDAMSYVNLSQALMRQGDRARAIDNLRAAVVLRPDIAELHYQLGSALAADGRWDDALRSFGQAVQRAPQNPVIRNELAAVLATLGRFEDALPHFRAVTQITPTNPRAWNSLAQCALDLPIATPDQLREAQAAAQRAVQLTSNQDPAMQQTLTAVQARLASTNQPAAPP